MNEEILAGLKGAVSRGFKLEESMQSFINAGYTPAEVKEAASLISKGFSPLPSSTKEPSISKDEIKPKSSSKMKWILIILLALTVLGLAISFLLLRDKILGMVIDPFFP